MKRSLTCCIILATLAGIIDVVNSTSDRLPRQLVERSSKEATVVRRSEDEDYPPLTNVIDVSNAGFGGVGCYEREDVRGNINPSDCAVLFKKLKNSDSIAPCGPGQQRYHDYDTCAVFFGVSDYAVHNYSMQAKYLRNTIPAVNDTCNKNPTGYYGGYIELDIPENQVYLKEHPNSDKRAPIATAVFFSPKHKGDDEGGKEKGKGKGEKNGKGKKGKGHGNDEKGNP
ncbi:hypothetical protein PPACK8108_LOCUS18975 [Phakopsora pachyrhizi]|uniref:Secreted protein n=1 Tax=Phakopsora pachyrhizi TaxID=170000 RepID=A0AAV0BDN8_PHAPC|nr:hypothetical protein PPACK8108_LOCUS18975 [Phakopsora pachyrhizi]